MIHLLYKASSNWPLLSTMKKKHLVEYCLLTMNNMEEYSEKRNIKAFFPHSDQYDNKYFPNSSNHNSALFNTLLSEQLYCDIKCVHRLTHQQQNNYLHV